MAPHNQPPAALCNAKEAPVIRGTRITVELILRKLAEGETESELLEDYPHLTPEDIRAAIAYGAASVAHEEVVLLADANPSKS
jgi:uncharacterized protein (DUF433 family)